MDFLRRISLRHGLAAATAILAAAGFGAACQAQDDRGQLSQDGYHGPYLAWSGKKAPEAPPPSDLAEARYAPAPDYAPGAYVPQSPRSDAPPLNDAAPHYIPASYAPAPQSAPAAQRHAAAFAPPAPQPAQAAPAPVAAPSPPTTEGASELFPPPEPPAAQAAPAPAAAPSPAHPAQASAQGPAEGPTSVRFYSLHRDYGMAPDPIPAPTEGHTVLIGPPDHGAAAADQAQDQSQDGDADQDQAGGKSAAHGDAADDGQNGDN